MAYDPEELRIIDYTYHRPSGEIVLGRAAEAVRPWKDHWTAQVLDDPSILSLTYEPPRGTGANLDFLPDLSQIRYLCLGLDRVADASALESCHSLESLSLGNARPRALPDICQMRGLRDLTLHGAGEMDVVGRTTQLTHLSWYGYPYETLQPLAGLARLQELSTSNGRLRSTVGLAGLRALRRLLIIDARRLTEIVEVDALQELEHLEILSGQAIPCMEEVASLPNLRCLCVSVRATIESLAPLADCPALENVSISKARVEDGHVRFLMELPTMKAVYFSPIRGYDATAAELREFTVSKLQR